MEELYIIFGILAFFSVVHLIERFFKNDTFSTWCLAHSNISMILTMIVVFGVVIATQEPDPPLERLQDRFSNISTYSVVLADQKIDSGTYQQMLTYIGAKKKGQSDQIIRFDWEETSEEDFKRNLPFLGMTIFTKKDGIGYYAGNPPGYEYVNNPKYGEWKYENGQSTWVWFSAYAFWNSRFHTPPVSRLEYNAYKKNRDSGSPYFGKNHMFGTQGKHTAKYYPFYYARSTSSELTKKALFTSKVNNRIGRTAVAVRGRGSAGGK